MAELKAEAVRIEMEAEVGSQTQAREAEIQFVREQNELEITKANELGKIEVNGTVTHSLYMYTMSIQPFTRFGPLPSSK